MSQFRSLGAGAVSRPQFDNHIEYIVVGHALQRVMAFIGCSIDDVVNDPIVKNQVIGYYKLHKFVEKRCEIVELEKQWNPLGRR